jgi:hypothetical protein
MAIEKISSAIVDNETKDLLRAIYADITDLRAKLVATQAKLDADATVTDEDYESLGAPATQQLTL